MIVLSWWSRHPDEAGGYVRCGLSNEERVRWLRVGYRTAADVRRALASDLTLDDLEAAFARDEPRRKAELKHRHENAEEFKVTWGGSGNGNWFLPKVRERLGLAPESSIHDTD